MIDCAACVRAGHGDGGSMVRSLQLLHHRKFHTEIQISLEVNRSTRDDCATVFSLLRNFPTLILAQLLFQCCTHRVCVAPKH